jgi:transcriptional regulator with XRE-family HTH domain
MDPRAQTRLGAFIRDTRSGKGHTQAEVEEALGIDKRGYISKLESGVIQRPTDKMLRLLAGYCETEFDTIKAMCETAAQARSVLKMACGYSLWNAPLICAAGEGLLPGVQISSFYRRSEGGTISSDKLRASNLDWIAPYSAAEKQDFSSLVPLAAADVGRLIYRGDVDIVAMPGNLLREGYLKDRLTCVGTVVDTVSGCSLVYPKTSDFADELAGLPNLGTAKLGELLLKTKDAKGKKRVRLAAQELTIAAEYIAQACQAHPGKLDTHDVLWHSPAADLAEQGFKQLAKACQKKEEAELLGVITWEPLATWLCQRTGHDVLKTIPLHFVHADELTEPRHLTYEIAISDKRIGEPAPLRKELYHALAEIMGVAADMAKLLNEQDGSDALMGWLAGFYRFKDPGTPESADEQAIKLTKKSIARILYSVRWNVVPQMGVGPQV